MRYEAVKNRLKEVIDEKSLVYLRDKPYAVYEDLLKNHCDPFCARVVLMTMLAGCLDKIQTEEVSGEDLTAYIQKECGFNKKLASTAAEIYSSLFGNEELEEWKGREMQGLRDFCDKEQKMELDAHAVWYAGNVHVDCDFWAKVRLWVRNKKAVEDGVANKLKKNPYMTEEEIRKEYERILQKELEYDLDEYATSDDYYPPVAEDYDDNFEYDVLKPFCEKYGFEVVSWEGEGSGSDSYEPNF